MYTLCLSACLSLCLSLRKCVDCHLSYGFTQNEAGHCNSTCAPLVGYMDDVSGTVNRICSEHSFTLGCLQFCGSEQSWCYKGAMTVFYCFTSGLDLSFFLVKRFKFSLTFQLELNTKSSGRVSLSCQKYCSKPNPTMIKWCTYTRMCTLFCHCSRVQH